MLKNPCNIRCNIRCTFWLHKWIYITVPKSLTSCSVDLRVCVRCLEMQKGCSGYDGVTWTHLPTPDELEEAVYDTIEKQAMINNLPQEMRAVIQPVVAADALREDIA